MNILKKFTLRSLKLSRTRTLVTVIGIMLSMSLFTAVIEGGFSGLDYLARGEISVTGSYHAFCFDAKASDVEKLRTDENVKKLSEWKEVGYMRINSHSNYDLSPFLAVRSVDESFRDLVTVDITEGRMPENDHEIALPSNLRSESGTVYSVGDTVSFELGERIYKGDKLHLYDALYDEETLENIVTHEYTVVGKYRALPGTIAGHISFVALTSGDVGNGSSGAFFILKNPSDIYDYVKDIGIDAGFKVHRDLLIYYGVLRGGTGSNLVVRFMAVLIAMIMLGSVSLIYNSFSISVSERTRQFGLLKSVGATKKQIRASVLYEALVLSAVGIPLGMLVGCVGIGITLWALNDQFAALLFFGSNVRMHLTLNAWALLGAAVICLITTLISAYIPAKRAMRVSPIESIRQTADIKIKRRDLRTSPLTLKIFGFEGMLATKNYGRNRKRYRSTVISLVLSLVLFISASSFSAYLINETANYSMIYGLEYPDISYSAVGDADGKGDEIFAMLSAVEGVTDRANSRIYSVRDYLKLDTSCFTKEYYDALDNYVELRFVFTDDERFKLMCCENGLDPTVFFDRASPKAVTPNSIIFSDRADNRTKTAQVFKQDAFPVRGSVTLKPQMIDESAFHKLRRFDETEGEYYTVYIDIAYYEKLIENGVDADELATDEFDENYIRIRYDRENTPATYDIDIIACVNKMPPIDSERDALILVYPEYVRESMLGHGEYASNSLTFTAPNHAKVYEAMLSLLKGAGHPTYLLHDLTQGVESAKAFVTVINVFAYGFIILISLITVANVFNTISTSILLRRRELAMLRSVGMTSKGFNKMMCFECLRYGMKGLLFGLPLSVLMSALIYYITHDGEIKGFYMFSPSLLIAVSSVFAVVFATMIYSVHRIRKDDLVATLKNENI